MIQNYDESVEMNNNQNYSHIPNYTYRASFIYWTQA